MKKVIKYFKIGYLALIVIMLTAWLVRYSMLGGNRMSPKIENAVINFATFPTTVYNFLHREGITDDRYIFDTVTKAGLHYWVDTAQIPNGGFLISTFKKDKSLEIKLLDIKRNIFVKRWNINPDSILKYSVMGEINHNNIRLFHPVLLKDSSLVFNTQYLLFKVDKHSKIVWVNKHIFHHAIESASDTSVWACGTIVNKRPKYMLTHKDTLVNDAVTLVSTNTGKVIFQKSLYDMLNENGYNYLITIGPFENDAFHLNEVDPAPKDTKYWIKGDLLISMRHRNTVFLYRPSTNKILWLKTGPWANQHSCTFMDDERIMVFGNDVIRNDRYTKFLYGHSNIYTYNFKTNVIDTPYHKWMNHLKIQAYTEGRCNILSNGDIFFDDSNSGKVYILNKDTLKLTYCDRIDSKHVKMMNLVRYIPN
jgi:hypothetical protein